MKKLITAIFILTIPVLVLAQTSIYDIQYTTDAGDGTYPSAYNGQQVTTGGIVTATGYSGGRYFISSSHGGAWSGIYIYNNTYSPSIGDSIIITGIVYEYNGMTEIKNLSSYTVISSSNPVPEPVHVSTNDVTSEAYECVLVKVNNSNVYSVYDNYGNFAVNDGSGYCEIRPGIFNLKNYGFRLFSGYPFQSITGVVAYNYGVTSIQPRTIEDFISGNNAFILSTDDKFILSDNSFSVPVWISILNQSTEISNYELKMAYDPAIIQYTGFTKAGTISESGTITDASTSGNINLSFSGSAIPQNQSTLITLHFNPIDAGNSNLQFGTCLINGNNELYYSAGTIQSSVTECDIPIGDTITIIQRPLFNIPSIVTPGQTLKIECFAPETTTDWSAELFFDNTTIPLSINNTSYNSYLDKWTLNAEIPEVELYELYDLKVSASGGLTDDVSNAVKVIENFKDNFYFVHITDAHMPTHYFYEDPEGITDTSELNDMYEIIKDINLLRPEFVLFTGDIINEGELEDFECRRNHTRTIELLKRFEVPVYIVSGNHDLGGWDATPPSQGTARREWWRFFGWRQHQIPPVLTEYYTQDYSFDYGDVHFTGLESYDNYDNYLYNIYGETSFIPSQIEWLENDLANAGDKTKVLFYHYDFKHELNLSTLGVDMALWGHIHNDDGDIQTHPYNLSTDNVCDGNRAYRMIRVNNGSLTPENTIKTHNSGDMLSVTYPMENNGLSDSLSAIVSNKFSQSFENGLIKFKMPLSDYGFTVHNGVLEQVLNYDSYVICYVSINIPSNSDKIISIVKNDSQLSSVEDFNAFTNIQNFPNPFKTSTTIKYNVSKACNVKLEVYDSLGKRIKTLENTFKQPGEYHSEWDTTNSVNEKVNNGVYFYTLHINNKAVLTKQMILAK